MAPTGPKLELIEATETTISVEFKPVSSISTYELQYKSVEQPWSTLKSMTVPHSSGNKGKAEAHDLQPGTTYCLRLVCVQGGSQGEPGPELIIDTEQVGCTPQQSGGCGCAIQ